MDIQKSDSLFCLSNAHSFPSQMGHSGACSSYLSWKLEHLLVVVCLRVSILWIQYLLEMRCRSILHFTEKLRLQDNAPPHFAPWESDLKRRQPCQVQSSLIPCMLRHLNRAEAAGPHACESTGFPEERQWHPVFRLGARQWSFCIPKEPWSPRTWLPVSNACPSAEKRNPVLKAWAFTASSVAFWRFTGCWLANSEGGGGGFLRECIIRAEGMGSPWKTAGWMH